MSRDVARVEVSRATGAHSRAAELVARNGRLNRQLDAYFAEIAEVKELMRAEKSAWDGPIFEPLVEAAFWVWESRGPTETRIEIDRLGPVPMMELEDE